MADKSIVPYYANQSVLRWQDIAAIAIRHRGLIQRVTLCGAILFTVIALIRQPTYSASAKLLVTPRIAETPVTAEADTTALAARGSDYRRLEAEINSTVAMLTSPKLIEAALRKNQEGFPTTPEDGLAEEIAHVLHVALGFPNRLYRRLHGIPEVSGTEAQVGAILGALVVRPVDKADLIEITYTGEDPRWSAGFVNALIETHLSPEARTGDEGASLRFFQEQRGVLEEKFHDAQAEFRDFRKEHEGDLAFDDEQGLRSIRLALQTAKATADTELLAATAELDTLGKETSRLARSLPVGVQVAEAGAVSSLRAQVVELELEKSLTATKFAPGSHAMRDVEQRLQKARALLEVEKRSATTEFRAGGAGMQQLTMDMVAARARKAQLEARASSLSSQIDDYARRLDRLEGLSSEHEQLGTALNVTRKAYLTYVQKEEEARFASALDESGVMNVVVASPAAAPLLPDPSAMWLTILFGTLLSFGTGIGLVLVRDRMDLSVTSALEAEQVAGFPVISVLWADGESRAPARRNMREPAAGDRVAESE